MISGWNSYRIISNICPMPSIVGIRKKIHAKQTKWKVMNMPR